MNQPQGGNSLYLGRARGEGPAMEHEGDLYSCDHFVEPKSYLGNIVKTPMIDLVDSEQQRKFETASSKHRTESRA